MQSGGPEGLTERRLGQRGQQHRHGIRLLKPSISPDGGGFDVVTRVPFVQHSLQSCGDFRVAAEFAQLVRTGSPHFGMLMLQAFK